MPQSRFEVCNVEGRDCRFSRLKGGISDAAGLCALLGGNIGEEEQHMNAEEMKRLTKEFAKQVIALCRQ